VLQAVAARSGTGATGAGPLLRMVRRTPFLVGLALDGCGFLAQFAGLRLAPVFLVQAAMASSLAVTAVVAAPVLKVRLRGAEWLAVGGVVAGLALLGVSAGGEGGATLHPALRYVLLGAVAVLAAAGYAVSRLPVGARPGAYGAVAGLGFAVTALAARSLTSVSPADLVRDPGAYAVLAAGVTGFTCYALGLQAGSVTVTTAATVVGETVVPAALGVLLLGDATRPGYAPVAAAGFVLAVAGALVLARFGEVDELAPARPV
jgi:drug/metabolite transporter (DMT)-like permease